MEVRPPSVDLRAAPSHQAEVLYQAAIVPMTKTLTNVPAWFDAAEAQASAMGFDVNVLIDARLSPSQFPLVRQVQAACDTLKLGAARLTGVTAPKHDDVERTFAELRTRVAETLAFVEGLDASMYAGAEDKLLAIPLAKDKVATGQDFVLQFSLPNFYFHVTHVYALLRHNGVPLGKMSYIGSVNMRDA